MCDNNGFTVIEIVLLLMPPDSADTIPTFLAWKVASSNQLFYLEASVRTPSRNFSLPVYVTKLDSIDVN